MLSTGLQPRFDILMYEEWRFFSFSSQWVRPCGPEADQKACSCHYGLLCLVL